MTAEWLLPPIVCAIFGVIAAGILITQAIRDGQRSLPTWGRRAAMAVLVLIMGVTPAVPQHTTAAMRDLDVIIVVDRTTSMTAADMPGGGTRFDAMRDDLKTLARHLAGARFQIIGVTSHTGLELPATNDAGAVISYADSLTPEIAYGASGSTLEDAADAVQHQIADTTALSRNVVLVVMSDGEVDQSRSTLLWEGLKNQITGGATLAYGTRNGGTMEAYLGGGRYDKEPVIDPDTGKPAITHADPGFLASIGKAAGITSINRTTKGSLEPLYQSATSSNRERSDARVVTNRHIIWPATWLLVALLAWEAYAQARRVRIRRDRQRLVAERPGGGR
ncbi:MAG: VWA domain-containing protein [Actinomycetaceae bacterium]|nr:VWA domain-containing protein [Actinomycetaceae bacterium]MDU0971049.1 VWA domain-containing protein [Actinomycetaceae bacterium]